MLPVRAVAEYATAPDARQPCRSGGREVIRIEGSVVINRPPDEVARFITDIERQTEWTDMTASRKLTDGPVRTGTQAYAEVAMGPFKLGWTWELTDYDPASHMTFKTVSKSSLGMDGTYRWSPEGSGATRLDGNIDVHTHGLLRLLEPIMRGEIIRNEAGELERIKAALEREAPVA
jgi:Polyketide cyclase / dehydrase and lipid transport